MTSRTYKINVLHLLIDDMDLDFEDTKEFLPLKLPKKKKNSGSSKRSNGSYDPINSR